MKERESGGSGREPAGKAGQRKVVLVTGASSGIGKALAARLVNDGCEVFGAARSHIEQPGVRAIRMDVDDDTSVTAGVARILDEAGRIDVLVNNAGIGIAGSVEETLISEARKQMETNFFGTLRVTKAVLPIMRRRRTGLIINVGSVGGIMGIPFQGLYTASKFAMEGLSEVIHLETSKYGIRTVVVEPGDVQTGFTAARRIHEAHKNSEYPWFGWAVETISYDENHGLLPEYVAEKIARIVAKRSPRFRYVVSLPSQKLTVILYRMLPYRVFAPILQSHYRIKKRYLQDRAIRARSSSR